MYENQTLPDYLEQIEAMKEDKRYDDALRFIEGCLAKNIDDYRLYEELADVYLYKNDPDKALDAAQYAHKLFPESSTGLYLLGYVAVTKGDWLEGIRLLEKSNALQPNAPEVLRNLGWAYVQVAEHKKGEMILKRALNLAPDDDLIMEDLGMALLAGGDFYAGAMWLKKAGREDRLEEYRGKMGMQ